MYDQIRNEGFCVIPDVLGPEELRQANDALDHAVEESRRRGVATYTDFMDPNDRNVRVYALPEFDPLFVELLRHPMALAFLRDFLGPHFIVSSFTANIAYPGSGSMNWHSDQSVTLPPPWTEAWTTNLIWCLSDTHEANGATRYLPGSHRFRDFDDVPADPMAQSRPMEARAGSVIAVDGRLWHTSGSNVTENERRALLFGYYCKDFVRPQANHEAALSPETKAGLDEEARQLLGLGAAANVRLGAEIVQLTRDAAVDPARQYGSAR